ncbi:MAG TPA: asparagine synthase (glutamine-hydrolyzing) [Candidatus Acidoferrum sp.]|nr:asparagine synthase (glutamine-hydrolyzing) [Candidatus Acidoferrum sp.]
MCGIAGIHRFDGAPPETRALQSMLDRMVHRGPDDQGSFTDGGLTFGIRRLSIIDVKGGHQPIESEDGRYCIVFNGEIYNFLELRADLVGRHTFRTHSDTEVLLHLYEERGPACLADLNGMFAFAVWDRRERELFVARDRLGIKPLFYVAEPGRFAFSSELRSLVELTGRRTIDETAFLMYLLMMYVPAPDCLVEGIRKLPPAHYLKIDRHGRIETRRYWDVERFGDARIDEREARERLLELLRDAIRLQQRSDVPLGIFLSGGLDSGTVVALMAEQVTQPVRTFSVGFEGHLYDERPAARMVAARHGARHRELLLDAKAAIAALPEVAASIDEPVCDSAAVPTLLLSRLAREDGITVILNGTGGDEVFGGYPRYSDQAWRRGLEAMPRGLRRLAGLALGAGGSAQALRLRSPVVDYLCRISGRVDLMSRLLRDPAWTRRLTERLDALLSPIFHDPRLVTAVSRRTYFDLHTYLAGDLLPLLDKMTMAASVEGRVPLLDHRLVEWMFALPDRYRVAGGATKRLFRQAIGDLLPKEVLAIPKRGFGAPVGHWLAEAARESDEPWDRVWKSDEFLRDRIDVTAAAASWTDLRGASGDANLLFGLTLLAEWRRQVLVPA